MTRTIFKTAAFKNRVGEGVSDSYFVTVGAVAKGNAESEYCVPNEYICCEIGRFLRLPVPPGALVNGPNGPEDIWFASLNFNADGETLPPADIEYCLTQFPMLSTGLLLFDILIANSDRHSKNLYVDRLSEPPEMTIFDHSHALFGGMNGVNFVPGQQRLDALKNRLAVSGGLETGGNRHCLLDRIQSVDYFDEWFRRIGSIPDFFIAEVCAETVNLGVNQAEAEAARDFIIHRRDKLKELVESDKDKFSNVGQWSLAG
jgi:hypothetical protein